MLGQVIESKRKQMKEQGYEHIDEADRDILTLMLEGELNGEGKLSDEELIGDLNVFFIGKSLFLFFFFFSYCLSKKKISIILY